MRRNITMWAVAALGAMLLAAAAAAQNARESAAGAPNETERQQQEGYSTMGAWATTGPNDLFGDGKTRLIIRMDDVGFCHASNMAFKRIAETGQVSAVSILVNTPWLDEAVEIAKEHPEISYGVHTCLNSEWWPYRWGPVLPADEVPSLVNEWGKFHGTRKDLFDGNPSADEMEREVRAQIDLALAKGLKLSYIDHHMGAAVTTPEFKERFEKIAKDYGLAISRWFGESAGPNLYSVPPDEKADFVLKELSEIDGPGTYLMVCHTGMDVPEMQAMKDLNATGLPNMSEHRQAETDALCDPRLKALLEEKGIELVGYDVFQERFLDKMQDPNE